MTDSTLSPAAQAVLDAYMANCGWLDGPLQRDYQCVAATLRAAADHTTRRWIYIDELLAIAAELEDGNG
jgi:hypothetical protein